MRSTAFIDNCEGPANDGIDNLIALNVDLVVVANVVFVVVL